MAALALLAGAKTLLLSLAFPFFTNVDEYRHLDVVLKYVRGHVPAPGPEPYEPEALAYVARFGSPEYHRDPVAPLRAELPRPLWESSPADVAARTAQVEAQLAGRPSLEADQPPVYYATAAAWWVAGRGLGLAGAPLLYWLRALGALAAAALVGVAWWALRGVYADRALVRVGVPLLLAAFPLDAVLYVTGDALSPLLGGLAFAAALRLAGAEAAGRGAALLGGLVLAAAFLCKYPSAALYPASALLCVGALRARPDAVGRWALYWAAALLPVLAWLARNQLLGGGFTGTSFKVEQLGWTPRPAALWAEHPLFTPAGAWTFLWDLLPSFWRGELVWYRRELAWPTADLVYRLSSLLLVALAALGLVRRGRPRERRLAEAAALLAVGTAVALLAGLSLLFEFGERTHPSRAYPYFVQGRLIGGVLLPFALLWVRGLDEGSRRLPGRWRQRGPAAFLALVVLLALVSEAWLVRPVFASPYNGFHLP